jgi:hypothetical protein
MPDMGVLMSFVPQLWGILATSGAPGRTVERTTESLTRHTRLRASARRLIGAKIKHLQVRSNGLKVNVR